MFAAMPDQYDLEPKDYRAQPLKGERVFAPGGFRRLAVYAAFIGFGIVVAVLLRAPALGLSDWLWSLWH